MIYLPVFDNYENIDVNVIFEEKDTLTGALKEIAGTGLSGATKNHLNIKLIRYIKYFRYLNNYRIGFDVLLNGLIQGANIAKQFEEFMENFSLET